MKHEGIMIPPHYSKVTLPQGERPFPTIVAFLATRFPNVSLALWEQRILQGKVVADDGRPITMAAPFLPGKKIFYYREVEEEPVIPFAETIIFQNDDLVVACKPHFLPVNPTGPYVAECLQGRLRRRTGNDDLVPVNRIDRETAGIVLFSANPKTRDLYYRLFREGMVEKTYEAIAECREVSEGTEWMVENRMVKGEPWFRMKAVAGEANARSVIRLQEARGSVARFVLHPLTGKTHQLRLHMSGLGFRILNDRYYPELQPEAPDDFANPLQLLAKRVTFRDPVTGVETEFVSQRKLREL